MPLLLVVLCCTCVVSAACTVVSNSKFSWSDATLQDCTSVTLFGDVDRVLRNVTVEMNGSSLQDAPARIDVKVTLADNVHIIDRLSIRIANFPKSVMLSVSVKLDPTTAVLNSDLSMMNISKLAMRLSSVFIAITADETLNVTVLLSNVKIGGTLPEIEATSQPDGLVVVTGTTNCVNVTISIKNSVVAPLVYANYAMVRLSGHSTTLCKVELLSTVVNWILNCTGTRANGCARSPVESSNTDVLYIYTMNEGLLLSSSVRIESSTIAVRSLTDTTSQSGFASTVIRVTGDYNKKRSSLRLCSFSITNSDVSLHMTEMANGIIVAYMLGGANQSQFTLANVSSNVSLQGDVPRARGRSVALISVLYEVALWGNRFSVSNVVATVLLSPGSAGPALPCEPAASYMMYCLDAIATVDVIQLGEASRVEVLIGDVSLHSWIRSGFVVGLQLASPAITFPISVISSCMVRIPVALNNSTVRLVRSSHFAVIENVTFAAPKGQVMRPGSASVIVGLFYIAGNVTNSLFTVSSSSHYSNFRGSLFGDVAKNYADIVEQSTLVTFNITCSSCRVLKTYVVSLNLPGMALGYFFPQEVSEMQHLELSFTLTNLTTVSTDLRYSSVYAVSFVLAPSRIVSSSIVVTGCVVDTSAEISPFYCMIGASALQSARFQFQIDATQFFIVNATPPGLLFSPAMPLPTQTTLGCNSINRLPFPSASTFAWLPHAMQRDLLSASNRTLHSNDTTGMFRIDRSLLGFRSIASCDDYNGPQPTLAPNDEEQVTSVLTAQQTALAAFFGGADAPLLIGVLSSKCGGASVPFGRVFLSPFYALGVAASVFGNIAIIAVALCLRASAVKIHMRETHQQELLKRIVLFGRFRIPLYPMHRFPNWDVSACCFLLQGTLFYSARGVSDESSTTADVVAGAIGVVFVVTAVFVLVELQRESLCPAQFHFQRYRRHIREKYRSTLWRCFVPSGRWGPQATRLALGSLRASSSTHTTGRDSWADVRFVLAPLLFQVIFQALMGIDFRESKAGCGIAFLSAGSCSLALSVFFMLSKRNRSHFFCIVQVTSFGVQTLLLFAFAAAIFTDQDETARSFVIATAYAVSVASVVRMCATIATFVWESKQPTGALENSTAKKPSSDGTMFSKRKEPTLWRVSSQYHSLQLLVNEICFSRVSRKK